MYFQVQKHGGLWLWYIQSVHTSSINSIPEVREWRAELKKGGFVLCVIDVKATPIS